MEERVLELDRQEAARLRQQTTERPAPEHILQKELAVPTAHMVAPSLDSHQPAPQIAGTSAHN
jgi:hypothetical protein